MTDTMGQFTPESESSEAPFSRGQSPRAFGRRKDWLTSVVASWRIPSSASTYGLDWSTVAGSGSAGLVLAVAARAPEEMFSGAEEATPPGSEAVAAALSASVDDISESAEVYYWCRCGRASVAAGKGGGGSASRDQVAPMLRFCASLLVRQRRTAERFLLFWKLEGQDESATPPFAGHCRG